MKSGAFRTHRRNFGRRSGRAATLESTTGSSHPAEVLKARLHRGRPSDLYHLRENRGLELDLIVEADADVIAVEVKSGATVASDFFAGLDEPRRRVGQRPGLPDAVRRLIYGGAVGQSRSAAEVIPWHEIQDHSWL